LFPDQDRLVALKALRASTTTRIFDP